MSRAGGPGSPICQLALGAPPRNVTQRVQRAPPTLPGGPRNIFLQREAPYPNFGHATCRGKWPPVLKRAQRRLVEAARARRRRAGGGPGPRLERETPDPQFVNSRRERLRVPYCTFRNALVPASPQTETIRPSGISTLSALPCASCFPNGRKLRLPDSTPAPADRRFKPGGDIITHCLRISDSACLLAAKLYACFAK